MAAAAVDVGYLAQHLSVPESNLSALIDAPTAELVTAVLEAVSQKAQEFDELSAEKLQAEIGLETQTRGFENYTQVLKTSAEEARKEVETLRNKLQEEESRRQSLENQLQNLQSSSSTSVAQVEELQSRIARLEESKAEAFSLVDTKNKANDSLGEDLQKLHQKNVALTQEVNNLQKTAQTAQSSLNSAKFKEQSLQQEVDLASRNNEWFEQELKTKSDEYLKYRKEKGARIAELQRLNDDLNSNMVLLTSTNQQLRSRLADSQQKTDDAFAKIQQLNEAAANTQQNFNQERESHARLVELKEQQTETYKKRTRELEHRVEQLKDDAEAEILQIRKELEQTRQERDECEQKIRENEEELNDLRVRLSNQAQPGSRPQTPRNGSFANIGSPFGGTPGSIRSKGLRSTSDYLDEMYRLKGQLVTEKKTNAELRSQVDDVLATLEAKGPEIQELHDEKERLEAENEKMTHLADGAFKNRDEAKKAARKAESMANTTKAEVNILQSQLRDLSTQLQMLLFNQAAHEKGLNQLSLEEAQQLERLSKGEAAEGSLDDLSDTHQFISRQYVVYKEISELQTQNQELLRVTRELANQMESEEALEAKQLAAQEHEELQKLRDTNEILRDEVKSLQVRNNTYIQERDIFRRMAQQKASAGDIASVLGGSVDGSHQGGVLASIESNPEEPDYAGLLRELQENFDAYRTEQAVDRKTLKVQSQKLVEEKNLLQTELARISSQLTLAHERYEMLQSNFTATKNENVELQRRSQNLSESAAKQDAAIQKLAEEHVEDRAMLETMRSENANLKAEKNLWKDIQDRLNQSNESLSQEKAQLNALLTSQQRIQNERDLSDSEDRRRLQNQIDSLNNELAATKKKLAEQMEESKNLQLRKEFDARTFQARIDELSKSLSQGREEHVATKTSRDYLQARVNELAVQLRNAEDRAERLVPIPSSRPRPAVNGEQSSSEESEARIQELADEVAEVKRDLDLANAHLENAKAQTGQYRELLEAAEQDLQSVTETQDQYRQEMEAVAAAKESTIKELEQRVEDMSTELATSNRELSSLRDTQAEVARRYEDEKAMMEEDIKRLKGAEERYNEMVRCHRQDLRAQAEIATKAQQDYEVELVKHAEAAKTLQTIRVEYNKLKTESASLRAEAESAKHTLVENERSWEERRKALEQEISELKTRRDEANKTSSLLQQEYNKVIARIDDLQQNRSSTRVADGSSADESASNLQEINSYLRREKEILEVQFDLKVQEAKRLQQQLDYTQSQLDETRLKLDEERRTQSDSGRSSMAHKELMEKLNELNLFRESSATLRNELRQAEAQIEKKNARIQELESQIQPFEARVDELDGQKSFMEQEVKQLQEDRDRWQKRTEGILTKYGRADPEEVEQLKQSVSSLEAERDALKEKQQPLQAKVDELEANLEASAKAAEERRDTMKANMTRQFKERSNALSAARNAANAEKEQALAAKAEIETQLGSANSELSATKEQLRLSQQERLSLEQQFNNMKHQVEVLQQDVETGKTASAPGPSESAPSSDAAPATEVSPDLERKLADATAQLAVITSARNTAEQELESLRAQLQTAVSERDDALAKLQSQALDTTEATMQNGSSAEAGGSSLSDQEREELLAKIAAAEAEIEEATKHAEEVIKTRSEKMKTALNSKLQSTREQAEKEKAEFKTQMEKELQVRLDQEKVIWMAENKAGESSASAMPATPAKPDPAAPQIPTGSTPDTGVSRPSVEALNKLSDAEMRDLISKSATAKSIIRMNIKKGIDAEVVKMKAENTPKEGGVSPGEVEAKVVAAREQAVMMESKKSNLRINMAENKFRAAQCKINVVETAAKETPQKPVVEVWEAAKTAKPHQNNAQGAGPASAISTPVKAAPAPVPATEEKKPQESTTPKPATTNPFAKGAEPAKETAAAPSLENPFGSGIPVPATANKDDDGASATGPQRLSSLPMPATRGGGNQRGRGVYQAPRGGGRGGRGGRGGLNPSADNFAPGNKRPRGDGEAGANKRQRGGAAAGH
ncbi:hypothetical protein MKZ38_004465 [Zalerion maritima]|uniref:Nucleoprotein TPR/MLP1 domain-containing protein n=1 Tax=Zalerion maritima TaxID=339359 RepID=A0AAD5RXE2_9PEZI|nr:hypothetical protein MKZ38_004465 [Zalerion maritima]